MSLFESTLGTPISCKEEVNAEVTQAGKAESTEAPTHSPWWDGE